jgi:hypothetical protein
LSSGGNIFYLSFILECNLEQHSHPSESNVLLEEWANRKP